MALPIRVSLSCGVETSKYSSRLFAVAVKLKPVSEDSSIWEALTVFGGGAVAKSRLRLASWNR
jgi:hypothetical protein